MGYWEPKLINLDVFDATEREVCLPDRVFGFIILEYIDYSTLRNV